MKSEAAATICERAALDLVRRIQAEGGTSHDITDAAAMTSAIVLSLVWQSNYTREARDIIMNRFDLSLNTIMEKIDRSGVTI